MQCHSNDQTIRVEVRSTMANCAAEASEWPRRFGLHAAAGMLLVCSIPGGDTLYGVVVDGLWSTRTVCI